MVRDEQQRDMVGISYEGLCGIPMEASEEEL